MIDPTPEEVRSAVERLKPPKLSPAQLKFLKLLSGEPRSADASYRPAQTLRKLGLATREIQRNWMRLHIFTITDAGRDALYLGGTRKDVDILLASHAQQQAKVEGYQRECNEVEQTLGAALGMPWFKDDQKNFPGATEADGVCVGEHVPATIAMEAAQMIAQQQAMLERALPYIVDYGNRVTASAKVWPEAQALADEIAAMIGRKP